MRIVSHAYVQWIKQGRPTVGPEFMEEIMCADMEAMAHFHFIDDQIEFEKTNPTGHEAANILKELGYE